MTIAEGFDIGIASGWVTRGFVHSPKEWREKIEVAAGLGTTPAPAASPVLTPR